MGVGGRAMIELLPGLIWAACVWPRKTTYKTWFQQSRNSLFSSCHKKVICHWRLSLHAWSSSSSPFPCCLSLIPSSSSEAESCGKHSPQNQWHFLMTRQTKNVGKLRRRGGRFKPWAKFMCVCIHLSVCCLCTSCVSVCAAGCKLQAIEWRGDILKAAGK